MMIIADSYSRSAC